MMITYETADWSTVGILDLSNHSERGASLIVTLHAAGSNKAGYRNTFVKLSRIAFNLGFSVFRFDLPNNGESKVYNKKLNDLVAIRDLLLHMKASYHFKTLILVGHCVGGQRAINLTRKFPGVFDEIVLWHVAPIIYKMTAPRLLFWATKELKINTLTFRRVFRIGGIFIYRVLTYPRALIKFYIKASKNPIGRVSGVPVRNVVVVMNPSRTHYKNIDDGISLTRKSLKEMGFSQVEFISNNNKVFSTEWQAVTFSGMVKYFENLKRHDLVEQS